MAKGIHHSHFDVLGVQVVLDVLETNLEGAGHRWHHRSLLASIASASISYKCVAFSASFCMSFCHASRTKGMPWCSFSIVMTQTGSSLCQDRPGLEMMGKHPKLTPWTSNFASCLRADQETFPDEDAVWRNFCNWVAAMWCLRNKRLPVTWTSTVCPGHVRRVRSKNRFFHRVWWIEEWRSLRFTPVEVQVEVVALHTPTHRFTGIGSQCISKHKLYKLRWKQWNLSTFLRLLSLLLSRWLWPSEHTQ